MISSRNGCCIYKNVYIYTYLHIFAPLKQRHLCFAREREREEKNKGKARMNLTARRCHMSVEVFDWLLCIAKEVAHTSTCCEVIRRKMYRYSRYCNKIYYSSLYIIAF